jgi:hypothetical protein
MAITVSLTPPCNPNIGAPLCVEIFGGGTYCLPDSNAGLREVIAFVKDLSAQLNPMIPVFKVMKVIVDILAVIKAIPQAIALNPGPLISAIETLTIDVVDLVTLSFPLLSFPLMIIGMIKALLALVTALENRIKAIIAAYTRLANLLLLAQSTGNAALMISYNCAKSNLDGDLKKMQNEFAAIGSLIRVINGILCLLELTPIGPIDLSGDVNTLLEPLDILRQVLQALIDALNSILPPSLAFGGDTCP